MHSPVLVLGEALVDRFVDGAVCGGAPYNLARALHSLGVQSSFITKIGNDKAGNLLLADADSRGMASAMFQRDTNHPTGVVDVTLDAAGSPSYSIQTPAAWDFIEAAEATASREFSMVCFGTLALRHPHSRASILSLASKHHSLKFLDLNLRPTGPEFDVVQQALSLCDWLKLNDEELGVLRTALALPPSDADALRILAQRFNIAQIALTRGALGASIYAATTQNLLHSNPTPPVTVVDTVGAGDGFSAAWIAAQNHGFSSGDALNFACAYAASVCTHRGPAAANSQFFAPWRQQLHQPKATT